MSEHDWLGDGPFKGAKAALLNEIYRLTGSTDPRDRQRRAELMDPTISLHRENAALRRALAKAKEELCRQTS